MTDSVTHTPMDQPSVVCQTMRTTVTVATVFSIVFLVLLAWNFVGASVIGPRRENRMVLLKTRLQEGSPSDEQLAEIRQLDLTIRRNRIWRLDFARQGRIRVVG